MPTIGKATDGNSSTQFFLRSYGTINPIYFYTAVAGDNVTQFHWRGATNLAGDLLISIAVYTVTAGIPDIRAGAVTTIVVDSAIIQQWDSIAVAIALVSGQEYCLCWSSDVNYTPRRINEGLAGVSTDLTIPIASPWTEFNQGNVTFTAWADVVNTPIVSGIIFPCCAQLIE